MIKPNELRLGNYVKYPFHELQVCQLFVDSFQGMYVGGRGCYMYESCDGIPLTSEWLLKFGFKLVGSQTYEKTCGDEFTIKVEDDQHCGTALFLEGSGAIPIYFLHQLQNIVHAITGEELTIQE